MRRHSIIGIHGLNNKPEPRVLADGWRQAIVEGLERNQNGAATPPELALVYWADLMFPEPVPTAQDMEPYVQAPGTGPLPRPNGSLGNRIRGLSREWGGGLLDRLAATSLASEWVEIGLAAKAPELQRYYDDQALRQQVRQRLVSQLRAAQQAGHRIVLIAHSMGSIIAYDVLAGALGALGELPGLRIEHFITLGSPLGLSEVKARACRELAPHADQLHVPDCVARWTNFADRHDPIALDSQLGSDYLANAQGVAITDCLVLNGYVGPAGRANPHKIYGYLRTPELGEVLASISD